MGILSNSSLLNLLSEQQTILADWTFDTNVHLLFGTGLDIFFDGTNPIIEAKTGDFILKAPLSNGFAFNRKAKFEGAPNSAVPPTNNVDNWGLLVSNGYVDNNYYGLLGLYTNDNNASQPKAGIYSRLTGAGSYLFLGTSNLYSSGINVINLELGYDGGVRNKIDSAGFYTGALDDLALYHNGLNSVIRNYTGDFIIASRTGTMYINEASYPVGITAYTSKLYVINKTATAGTATDILHIRHDAELADLLFRFEPSTRFWTLRSGTNGTGTEFIRYYEIGDIGILQSGKILFPLGDNTSDLGKVTNQWKDIYVGSSIWFGNTLQIAMSSTLLLRVNNSYGYIDIGTGNASYAHIYTDRLLIAFNKGLRPDLHNTHDLGQSTVTAWRNLYLGGTIYLGSDVNLYRSASNTLKTDDTFEASEVRTPNYYPLDPVDPPSIIPDGIIKTYAPTNNTVSGALNPSFTIQFSLPQLTGTQTLSSVSVTVNFQVDRYGNGTWVTLSSATISSAGFGAWNNQYPTQQASQNGSMKWRLQLVESGAEVGTYDIASFTPSMRTKLN